MRTWFGKAERIEVHRPAFNRALKNRSRGWYIEIDWGEPFPRLRIVRSRRRPRAQYLGPFRGRRGPAEAARLAEKLEIDRIVVPTGAGVGSAIGFLTAPVAFEVVRSRYLKLSDYDPAFVAADEQARGQLDDLFGEGGGADEGDDAASAAEDLFK